MTSRIVRRRARTALALLGAALLSPRAALAQAPPPPASAPAPAPPAADGSAADEVDVEEVTVVDEAPKPVPKDKGVITGTVVESSNGEGIIEAQISVVGTTVKALTDLDGNYRLELPPGVYELRVFYEGHKARRVQKATVAKGQSLRVDVSLEADSGAVEVVEIDVTPDRSSAATQILIRRNAANVGDAVSAQEIARTPDRNAAEAAKRVVGATILDGKFVYVRGLGERYTNALLNGSPLPSPEPDRQAVPLDLFPSLVLSDISILKTFTPDLPGDFAGGSVSIHTRQPTETFTVSGTASIGFNTESTFRDRLSYRGGNMDWLGVDSGLRSLPAAIPEYKLVRGTPRPDGTLITRDEIADYGRSLNSSMTTNRSVAPPNHSVNLVGSGTIPLGSAGKLGAMAAVTYGRRFSVQTNNITRRFNFAVDQDRPDSPFPYQVAADYRGEIGSDQVSWGGLAVASWSPSNDHRFTFTGLTSRSSDNEARFLSGPSENAGSNVVKDTRLRFLSRGLFFGELSGEHKLRALGGTEVTYRVSGSLATLDEPNTRQTVYQNDPVTGIDAWQQATLSGLHFYAGQAEQAIGGALDVTQPLVDGPRPVKIRFGGFAQGRERKFDARRFRYIQSPFFKGDPAIFRGQPGELFTDDNIGPVLELAEYTRPNDSYRASQSLFAGYLMADVALLPWLRILGGARVEAWNLSLTSFDPFTPELDPSKTTRDNLDVLPSLAVVLKTTASSNLRASVARTVARPQLRELSPFLYTDYFGARDELGNPDLKRSSIVSADLRFEYFPGAADVIAVSAFFKDFDDPIEAIIGGGSEVSTYANARGATIAGMEFELRKELGFIAPALSGLGALANLTIASSRVELDPSQGIQTSNVRSLVGQSPFVVNLGVDYANEDSGTRARMVYNVAGARIQKAGSNNLLDTYEQPRHLLDVAVAQRIGKHLDLKLSIENLLQSPIRATFGRENVDAHVVDERNPGTTFTLSAAVTN